MAGIRLNTPCTKVVYQALGSMLWLRSKANAALPGRTPPSWRSRRPYPRTPAAMTINTAPVAVKNLVRLIFSTRR